MTFRFAHMSDIHFCERPRAGGWTWRRLLGYANWRLRRRRRHRPEALAAAIGLALERPLDAVLLSGDIGQMGAEAEYRAAREALAPFLRRGIPVLAVAGNHDFYGRGPDPALADLLHDLRLGAPVSGSGVARVGKAEVLLCEQARRNRWFGSGGSVPGGLASRLSREWRMPIASGQPAMDAPGPLRLAVGHYPFRRPDGRPLPPLYGLANAEGWPALLDACGVTGYFCGHLHRKFTLDLTAACRQFCAGSVTAGHGLDCYQADGAGITPI